MKVNTKTNEQRRKEKFALKREKATAKAQGQESFEHGRSIAQRGEPMR